MFKFGLLLRRLFYNKEQVTNATEPACRQAGFGTTAAIFRGPVAHLAQSATFAL